MGSITHISEKKLGLLSLHFIEYLWIVIISKVVYLSMSEGDDVET